MSTSEKKELPKPVTTRDKWRHAFALGEEYAEKLTEEDEKLLDDISRAIVSKGLAAPALLWFTPLRPLNTIGANIIQAGQFIFKELALEVFLRKHFTTSFEHGAFVSAIEKREGIEFLISRIEKYEDERVEPIRKERKDRKNKKRTVSSGKESGNDIEPPASLEDE